MPMSAHAMAASFAAQTGEVFLVLLTITHPNLDEPIYLVNDQQNLVSRSHTFIAWPFDIDLPDAGNDSMPACQITFDNVDLTITSTIRSLQSPPSVTVEVVLASSPDTVEASFEGLTLQNVQYDASQIQAQLAYENVLAEPFPGDNFVPTNPGFPGLFSSTGLPQ